MQNTFTQDELQAQKELREKYRRDLFQVNGHQVENINDLEAYLELLAQREKDIYYEDYKKGGKPITELREDIKGLPRVYSMIFGSLIRKKEEIKELQKFLMVLRCLKNIVELELVLKQYIISSSLEKLSLIL